MNEALLRKIDDLNLNSMLNTQRTFHILKIRLTSSLVYFNLNLQRIRMERRKMSGLYILFKIINYNTYCAIHHYNVNI